MSYKDRFHLKMSLSRALSTCVAQEHLQWYCSGTSCKVASTLDTAMQCSNEYPAVLLNDGTQFSTPDRQLTPRKGGNEWDGVPNMRK